MKNLFLFPGFAEEDISLWGKCNLLSSLQNPACDCNGIHSQSKHGAALPVPGFNANMKSSEEVEDGSKVTLLTLNLPFVCVCVFV